MASRRTRSRGGAGSRRYQSQPSGPNMGLIGGIIAVVVVIAVVAIVMNSNDDKPKPKTPEKSSSESNEPARKKPLKKRNSEPKSKGRAGTKPDTPPPPFDQAALNAAKKHFADAERLDVEGRKAQKAGRTTEFKRLMKEANEAVERSLGAMSRYDEWFDLAMNLNDWEIPGSHMPLLRQIEKGTKLQGRLRRVTTDK